MGDPLGFARAVESDGLAVGERLGDFRVVRKLGSGGMGTVYLAEHRIVGTRVALKVLHPHLAAEPRHLERFREEARLLNLLGHENIVGVFDLWAPAGARPFLAMEYLEGRPLSSLMGFPLELDFCLPILVQICDALEAAHAVGVVHRDLKPENVQVLEGPGPRIKLVDFGIARLRGPSPDTRSGIVGTPEFMAPEQWEEGPVDPRTDLYALGAIAYAMVTGRPPFLHPSPMALYSAHRMERPTPPSRLAPGLPEGLEALILTALAKQPEERFASAAALRGALEAVLARVAPGRSRLSGPGLPSADTADLPAVDDPEAAALIERLEGVAPGDHYRLVGVAPDADWAGVRRGAHASAAAIQGLAPRLSAAQRERADRLLERLHAAATLLGTPAWRAAYDAESGNFPGVAACLGTGLGELQLEGLRRNLLEREPGRGEEARLHLRAGDRRALAGDPEAALGEWERALALDPLCFAAHERYWPRVRERAARAQAGPASNA